MNAESDEEVFEEVTATPGAGGGEAEVPSPAPQGETAAKATPWWQTWCDRIGAGEENLDATRTTLALQLHSTVIEVRTIVGIRSAVRMVW